jgi:hypothetical protein
VLAGEWRNSRGGGEKRSGRPREFDRCPIDASCCFSWKEVKDVKRLLKTTSGKARNTVLDAFFRVFGQSHRALLDKVTGRGRHQLDKVTGDSPSGLDKVTGRYWTKSPGVVGTNWTKSPGILSVKGDNVTGSDIRTGQSHRASLDKVTGRGQS